MLVVLSLATSMALLLFGSHWLFIGAFFVLVLRALQLPLVMTLVALRNPQQRIQPWPAMPYGATSAPGSGRCLRGYCCPRYRRSGPMPGRHWRLRWQR